MSKQVVASIRRQHVQALLLQLRKGCVFGGQETRQGWHLAWLSPPTKDRSLLRAGFFQAGVRLLDDRDDLLIALWPSGAVMSLTVRCASEAASRHPGFSRHRGSPFQSSWAVASMSQSLRLQAHSRYSLAGFAIPNTRRVDFVVQKLPRRLDLGAIQSTLSVGRCRRCRW